ncbi:WAT1-related protein At2g37460-like [Cucurbita pepo subsp. pepo]|uniref:WAT1-related protein At2g37460-like n=1 Tax=Cucurbita pepo subsp. pepo TaxID=3664 RepID=UPI000C9D678C|nr:WAT1-related protein At2g37460-like [Cucurbita pepo subsp. pepo]
MNPQVSQWCVSAKPFFAVVFLQFGLAGMDILSKAALNQGMSNYVLVVYRHAVATIVIAPFALIFDKKVRPKMTIPIFAKLMILSLLEPVIDQNLYFLGMKYTTATFAAAMCNILPAITFVMAWILRLEKVKIKSIRSQAKLVGTIATVGGAMIMTLIKGPILELFWVKQRADHAQQRSDISLQHTIKGSIMITIGCFSWACFMILQAITLKAYPAELSLTAWICLLGTAEGTVLALVMERGNAAVWSIGWGTQLLAAVYSGIFCSGLAYYIQGLVMKDKGPVFVTAFSPLSMVIVAIMSSFILGERLYFGRIVGAGVIIVGLYLVVWGKNKDGNSSNEDLKLPIKQTTEMEESSSSVQELNSVDSNNEQKS